MIAIRLHTADDAIAIWSMLEPVFRAGETYAIDRAVSAVDAMRYWCGDDHETWVAELGGACVGTYYLRANQAGGGAHVANCGYVTAATSQGQGVARAMLAHSLQRARARGFRAMQFNCVVSTNTRAIRLWEANGFAVVGRLPGAFAHPTQGFVDALVLYRRL